MCGLCGVVGPGGRAALQDLDAMTHALDHRGPDDRGTWTTRFGDAARPWEVGLGHTRLSILDLSPLGHQPMRSADGDVTVAYNGEIYNYRELRAELAHAGHVFRSDCDTEVLIEAYRAWGDAAWSRLVGMFAFALFDARRRRLVLVRDRLGIKPLYWRHADGVLTFGSELRALRPHRGFREEVDPDALAGYLRHGYVPGAASIYRGVRRLAPGEALVWEDGAIRTSRWWRIEEPSEEPPPARFEDAVARLEALLGDAVACRLVSDVPLGAFLSGGVDSSAVVALMRERATGPVRTFSIGFPEAWFDEAPHARAVAEHLGTEHTELYVRERDALEVALEMPSLFDEPFADDSAVPTVLLSRLTRRHVTVALSGDGGDELLGGYLQYPKLRRLLPALRAPRALRRLGAGLACALPGGAIRNGLEHLAAPDAGALAYRLVSGASEEALAEACGSGADGVHPLYAPTWNAAPDPEPVRRAMRCDAATYLPDDILTKVDRASMSVALEARVPLLDHRVVRYALSLPLDVVWRDGRTKAPLREILYRRVPQELIERPKHGFGMPIETLLGDRLRDWSEKLLAPERLREDGLLRPAGVQRLLDDARRRGGPRGAAAMRWRLVAFQRWFALHHRGERVD